MIETAAPCQQLDWDSDFFGCNIARATIGRWDEATIKSILAWCSSHKIDCFYFLSDADDIKTIRLAEEHGFRFVDIRVTLEKRLDSPVLGAQTAGDTIRLCKPDDEETLCAIARVSHRDSRFYHDPNFPTRLCDSLYETWIKKSCQGYANAVLVGEVSGQPGGYISCHLHDGDQGQIGLVGVSPDCQGQGLGSGLVNAALRWFADRSVTRVTVVTQGRNSKAQRLYQRSGFLTQSVQIWYHKWFAEETGVAL